MLKQHSCLFVICFSVLVCTFSSGADYTTPNSGSTYTLTHIQVLSGSTTVAGGPTDFTLNGNIIISPNDTFSIGAGEHLRAAVNADSPAHAIIVRGRILVNGTTGSPVLLGTQVSTPGVWRGIIIMSENASPSSITHAQIEYAAVGVQVRGKETPAIENCDFMKCMFAGVLVAPGFSATIRYNTIQLWQNSVGIILEGATDCDVASNIVTGHGIGLSSLGARSSSYLSNNSTSTTLAGIVSATNDMANMENNQIQNGYIGALIADTSTSYWYQNQMTNQSMASIGIVKSAHPKLRQNTMSGNVSMTNLFIDDDAVPNLGLSIDPGSNVFTANPSWDLVNFSALNQLAVGNTWSFPVFPELGIYDHDEDILDPDGNGIISGTVYLSGATSVNDWTLFGN